MSDIANGKPVWAQQITTARKRAKLSQQALAAKLSTGQSNVANWEAGRYKPAPAQFIELSKLFAGEIESVAFMQNGGVPDSFFLGKSPKGLMPTAIAEAAIRDAENKRLGQFAASGAITSLENPIRHVPLLKDAAAAGTPRAVDEDEIEALIPIGRTSLPRGGQLYAFPIRGDSMDPMILDGHIMIVDVDQTDAAKLVNKMVVARDAEGGITVKWLRQDGQQYLLVPQHVSVRHPIKIFQPGMAVVGCVVMWLGFPPAPSSRRK